MLSQNRMRPWKALSILLGDEPPTEIRLFKKGINATLKGDFLFDDQAAASVMDAYTRHGVDVMFDLEHLSIAAEDVTGDARNFNPNAMAWCNLAVRNGELWATNIRWTPEGEERVRSRKQRFLSPAFDTDKEGRVVRIFNVALTAIPATDDAPALIAARAQRGIPMDKKLLLALLSLLRGGRPSQKLAAILLADGEEGGGEGAKGKGAAVSAAADEAMASLEELQKAFKGGDVDAIFAAMDAAKSKVDAFENACAAMTGAPPDADAGAPPPAPVEVTRNGDESGAQQAMRAAVVQLAALTGKSSLNEGMSEIDRWRKSHIDLTAERAKLAAEKATMESAERHDLVAAMVTGGHERPATAWSDADGKVPAEPWASMEITKLRARVKQLGCAPASATLLSGAPRPPTGEGNTMVQVNDNVQISQFEIARIKLACDKRGLKQEDHERAIRRYAEVKASQIKGAEADNRKARMFSRPLEETDVICNSEGRLSNRNLVMLANPVQPIQEFGASSQRALEEFRLDYNTALASQPISWAEQLGDLLPGGSLKDTYPLSFVALRYREKTGQGAAAKTANNVDITVTKRLFSEAAEVELIRLVRGDFAYIRSWAETASRLADQRVFLRNDLVTALLEAGTTGYWGQTAKLTTGIDGQPFFSETHKVNPFDPSIKYRGSATWSNYQASATPLNASHLTEEKDNFLAIPAPDGRELNCEASDIVVPTVLNQTAKNLLTVQDLILAADEQTSGTGKFGTIRNPHYMSGFGYVRAPELTGTAVTADYYMVSQQTRARGIFPWVVAEDATEEFRVWDETSDFYKNGTGFIKCESLVYVAAVLLFPHAIRFIKGT